jgi:hypothetical protein
MSAHHFQVENYKGYRIYGTARQFGDCRWVAEGILFSNEFPERVRKVHRIKARPSGYQFVNRESAQEYALRLTFPLRSGNMGIHSGACGCCCAMVNKTHRHVAA